MYWILQQESYLLNNSLAKNNIGIYEEEYGEEYIPCHYSDEIHVVVIVILY